MTLSAHKWSSISDTHQNQLERCPNSTLCSQSSLNIRHTCQKQLEKCPDSTLCSKEKCAWVHTGRLTLSWGCQHAQMCVSIPKRKSISWQPVMSRGEIGRNPKTNGFGSCRDVAKCVSLPHRGLPAAVLVCSHGWQFYLGKLMKQHESAASHWVSKKHDATAAIQKPIKRHGDWKGKFALFQEPANEGQGM